MKYIVNAQTIPDSNFSQLKTFLAKVLILLTNLLKVVNLYLIPLAKSLIIYTNF